MALPGVVRRPGIRHGRPRALSAVRSPEGSRREGAPRRQARSGDPIRPRLPERHVDDLDWWRFVQGSGDNCRRQLWLDERGTNWDLADLVAVASAGKSRGMHEATIIEPTPLGTCRGARPWLGRNSNEDCNQPSRLLIRTASNAYFPQLVRVPSLTDGGSAVQGVVKELRDDLQLVDDAGIWHSSRRSRESPRSSRHLRTTRWSRRFARPRAVWCRETGQASRDRGAP